MIVKIKSLKAAKAVFLRSDLVSSILSGEKTIKQIPFGTRTSLRAYYEYAFSYNSRIHNYDGYMKVWEQLSSDMQQKHTQNQAKILFHIYTNYYGTLTSSYHQKETQINTGVKPPLIRISDIPPTGQANGRVFFTQAMNIPNSH